MVLSSYFDCQTDVPMYEIKTVEAESETQLAAPDGLECYWNAFELPYTFPASYLDPQNYTSLLPLYSIPPEVIPYETLSSYPCPKRHKLIEDHYCSDLMPGVFDGVAVSPCPLLEDHQINLEGMKTVGNCNKISEEKCVSVQSIAARERRRKITKKTQELGKLVPGGSKMNTAEMLQSAFKYIKYLQAQVGTLQVMDSFPENEKRSWDGKMEMVTSPKVQEKLYMEDKCLVAKDAVLSLTTLFKPPLSHELTRLLSLPSND
ncbi:hypothetical protein ERO13_D01G081900v2 [Gossypium hirsutum]|uniref:Transcription factor bHLH53 n=1 Tax=Gossypium hirsutum TaxID=3635 RepID=A0ABM2ZK90_GOSHI|nr:transcription factor bHLH53-like [Gossypium hirsutum]KAG4161858.1 hypothetical protein ERO13_D01G081900v2 [Gossypium hirsutum]